MPLTQALGMLSQETGLSFVAEASLDDSSVTVQAENVTINELMNMISRRIGVEVHRAGDIYYVGAFRAEDRALLVRRVRRLEADDINEAIGVLLSADGRVTVYDDGLVVIGDKLQVLTRINQLLDQVESAEAAIWAVQLWLVSLTDAALTDIGMDVTPSLDVAVAFAHGSAVGATTATLNGGLDAVLNAAEEQTDTKLVVEHLALIRDGVEHTFFEGTEYPVRVQRTSNEGTATTTDVTFVSTGLDITGNLREFTAETARLNVKIDLSEVISVVDGFAPQTGVTRFDAETIVQSGGVYLLRSHRTTNQSLVNSALLRPGLREEDRARTVQLWARARRVGGPVNERTSDVRSEAAREPDDASQGGDKRLSQQKPEATDRETESELGFATPERTEADYERQNYSTRGRVLITRPDRVAGQPGKQPVADDQDGVRAVSGTSDDGSG